MDPVYQMKLENAALAPDSAFPELLFDPIKNDFGDYYFTMDYEDYGKDAVMVDPRFTTTNIFRIKGTEKRIDSYLDNLALYEDYMAYLESKYGSIELAREMHEAGVLKEAWPRTEHPPVLKKGKMRKYLNLGVVPSFPARGVKLPETYSYAMQRIMSEEPPYIEGDEPDIQWAQNRKPSKDEEEMLRRNITKYRRQMRVEQLMNGTASRGVTSAMDFIDHYYADFEAGNYSRALNDDEESKKGLVDQMQEAEAREFWHQGQIWAEEDRTSGARYSYDGYQITDREKAHRFEILKQIQEYTGVDIINLLNGKGAGKKRIQAIREGLEAVGATVGLTEKEKKKLRKKQQKLERSETQIMHSKDQLSEILLNNKIWMNGGTVRFEDLESRRRRLEDEDW